VPLPPGLPESLLQHSASAASDLARRYARTHGPFTTEEFAMRYALGRSTASALLKDLAAAGKLLEGEFRPGGSGREWCDPDILQSVRRRSLARLRKQVEPVEPPVFVRLLTSWQGLTRKRAGFDALLDAIEHLQGAPLPATVFESEILAARVDGYNPNDLDALCAAGEVVWCGVEPIGDRDGRLALYLTDHLARLRPVPVAAELSERERAILTHLEAGASFFATLHEAAGAGFPGETVDALWNLVWQGLITNDTFHALRAFTRPPERRARKMKATGRPFRSRRVSPPSAEGRWSLVAERIGTAVSPTERSTAVAQQLLSRYGVLTREVAAAEGIYGGFSAVYDVLKALEDAGRIRRGYFVAGVGATQFALPPALELMRSLRELPDEAEVVVLSATDPANPFGTMLKWPHGPELESGGRGATRTVGAQVIIVNGALAAYLPRGGRQLLVYLPEDEPARSSIGRPLAVKLASIARGEDGRGGLMISDINGSPAAEHPLAPFLVDAGFYPSAMGFMTRRPPVSSPSPRHSAMAETDA
jgi:ATP-dependent Lhr-like helicase